MITEEYLEQLALRWFQETGWSYVARPDIAPETLGAERPDYRVVILKARLAAMVVRSNPETPLTALRDALLPKLLHGHLSAVECDTAIGGTV